MDFGVFLFWTGPRLRRKDWLRVQQISVRNFYCGLFGPRIEPSRDLEMRVFIVTKECLEQSKQKRQSSEGSQSKSGRGLRGIGSARGIAALRSVAAAGGAG